MLPVRVGTCGWSYKDWSGAFYPQDLSAGDYLAYVGATGGRRLRVIAAQSVAHSSGRTKP
jgi:uncharacterized protein YecE (DUF72 family)